MSQFCTSCGKPITSGAAFCTACGAQQAAPARPARSAPGSPAPATPAPAKGSPLVKIVVIVVGIVALFVVATLGSCVYIAYRVKHRAEQYTAEMKGTSGEARPSSTTANGLPDLSDAMSKLGDSIRKPTSSFHVFFKKASSDGISYSLEADVSPAGMTGQETEVSPKTRMGNMEVGGTAVHPRNATVGSPEWQMTAGGIEMAFLNPTTIRDAQPGVKYAGEEQAGGYDARRYDFDLASVPASEKAGRLLAGGWLGSVTGGKSTVKDYNVKGSAWMAKDDGRMVKFQFDSITYFSDGTQRSTHYEGIVTKK